jgi:hypothetical protein
MAAVHDGALPLTTLGRFELLNAIRLSVFRQQLNPRVAAIDVLTIKADIESGVLEVISSTGRPFMPKQNGYQRGTRQRADIEAWTSCT